MQHTPLKEVYVILNRNEVLKYFPNGIFANEGVNIPKTVNNTANIKHLIHTEEGTLKYKYEQSEKIFAKYVSKNHMATHLEKPLYECYICSKQFKRKVVLIHHLQTHSHSRQKNTCEFCTKHLTYEYLLLEHMRIHKDENPLICEMSKKMFLTEGHLKKHKNIETYPEQQPLKYNKNCLKGFGDTSTALFNRKQSIYSQNVFIIIKWMFAKITWCIISRYTQMRDILTARLVFNK